ncbi:uncharacterized protein LOC120735494 isoform X2 [Simochromis diagramma]|uniref:uncharacterized protein LOC120735494 isoform X2 n=1 Tax=Simochromis diagramma TaxID=43689 RepID=UPI001A7E49C2|nr:uncharacterized protein LOC120735494 isoform X2 [Simochromis diagramma]
METGQRKRSAYFTPLEIDILLSVYGEYEHIFSKKGNTAAAAKERELAWERIAARVNACNPTGTKRTWQQLKMKYKNIVQTANRKKAEARKVVEGAPPSMLTEAEEFSKSKDTGCPVAEPVTPQSASVCIKFADGLDETPTSAEAFPSLPSEADEDDDKDTLSAEIEPDRPSEVHTMTVESKAEHYQEEAPSTTPAHINTLPVKEIYKMHLIQTMTKTDKEITYLDRQIRKTDLEIELLEHQLEVGNMLQVVTLR